MKIIEINDWTPAAVPLALVFAESIRHGGYHPFADEEHRRDLEPDFRRAEAIEAQTARLLALRRSSR